MAERILYIPSIGYCLLVCIGFNRVHEKYPKVGGGEMLFFVGEIMKIEFYRFPLRLLCSFVWFSSWNRINVLVTGPTRNNCIDRHCAFVQTTRKSTTTSVDWHRRTGTMQRPWTTTNTQSNCIQAMMPHWWILGICIEHTTSSTWPKN